ncbi:THUMP domain-containing protein [Clostridium aminobutyricum]|uniref:Class I SAM-dependent RNA methyltransferase n=1 Tax=Clostridium aminobutyricum TaxID=33953 RepID=A0A939DB18_CLOAM|nr:class I SAM-dependent RNA methyltransferase [Clostridium aminobutyricum]
MKLELIATATFGLEALIKREIETLGYKIVKSEDAKITYLGDERAIVKSNLWLRCADRVLIKMGEFDAFEFEDLFQKIKGIAWEEWIPIDGNFKVNCSSVKSTLFSIRSCQSVSEKAIIERLKETYGVDRFEKSGAEYTVKVTLLKDRATVTLDTSGIGLHKRGYRKNAVTAPIKETLAAAMIQLSFWREGRLLIDPCCGSGTIPIEAAMIGRNIAPGLYRSFACEQWEAIPKKLWQEERRTAMEAIDQDKQIRIEAYDIDPEAIAAAQENAEEAGVDDCILFKRMNIEQMEASEPGGIIITNPPYGERIGGDQETKKLYNKLKSFFKENETWSLFVITPDIHIERQVFGRPADRRRKLYNGNIETCFYQFHGKKPPREGDESRTEQKAEAVKAFRDGERLQEDGTVKHGTTIKPNQSRPRTNENGPKPRNGRPSESKNRNEQNRRETKNPSRKTFK